MNYNNIEYHRNDINAATWTTLLLKLLRPQPTRMYWLSTNLEWVWAVVNRIHFLRRQFMRLVLKGMPYIVGIVQYWNF